MSNERIDAPASSDDLGEAAMALTSPPSSSDDDTLSPRGAAARHGTHHAKTFEEFVHRWRQHNAAGMRLIDIDVIQDSNGTPQFFGVWAPGTGLTFLYRYNSEATFLQGVEQQRQQNRKLVDIEIVRIGSTTWYYGVWVGSGNNDPITKSTSWAAFQALHAQRAAQGQRLVDIEISLENDQARYWGVWEMGTTPAQHLLRATSLSAFDDAYAQARAQGQRLRQVSGAHKSNQTQEYVGITDESSDGRFNVYVSWDSFKRQWASQAEAGRSLRNLEVITRPGGGHYYIGAWQDGPADPVGRTDTAKMATEIQDALSGHVVGFSYAIADQSQLAVAGAGGFAQRSPDPTHEMTSRTPSTMASVTKHLTAVATLALLERNELEPDTEILGYLPGAWEPHPTFNGLTFEHLLTHATGLHKLVPPGNGYDWKGLQRIVEEIGADPGATPGYKNANFALQRVLIPALHRTLEGSSIPLATASNHEQLYLNALDAIAFAPLGIEDISCAPAAGQVEALSYDVDDPTLGGKSWAPPAVDCGGYAGLQLNAQQLAAFLTGVRYNNQILSAASKAYMEDKLAGFTTAKPVDGGMAYEHGGDYVGGRETHTCVMRLPNGIDASLIINSDTSTYPCVLLRAAYNAATP